MHKPDGPSRRSFSVLGAALMLASAGVLVTAQAPQAPGRTIWDGVYTDAQAARGVTVFGASCANCHTLGAEGNRPLSGDLFLTRHTQKPLPDLLTYIRTSMPNGAAAGSLPASSYNDVLAAILKANGLPAGTTELAPEAIAGVQIVPKGGAGELPAGTLVRVVGCLARVGNDWVLTSATAPQRVDKSGVGTDDATIALGDRTTPLKFVVTRLDAFAGQRMSASGLLIGAGGSEGLNVTTVTRVAETCP